MATTCIWNILEGNWRPLWRAGLLVSPGFHTEGLPDALASLLSYIPSLLLVSSKELRDLKLSCRNSESPRTRNTGREMEGEGGGTQSPDASLTGGSSCRGLREVIPEISSPGYLEPMTDFQKGTFLQPSSVETRVFWAKAWALASPTSWAWTLSRRGR